MITSHIRFSRLASLAIVVAVIYGCASTPIQVLQENTGTSPQSSALRNQTLIVSAHILPRAGLQGQRSWMNAEARHEKLLYISDIATNDVNVYSYPDGMLVGQLTGFNEPQGECVDLANDIYIANTGDSDILEYAHGGSEPIATLQDPGQYPVDCVYARGLAVANIASTSGGPGSVSFFDNGSIQGTWSNPSMSKIYHIGHVGKNRGVPFFVDGVNKKTGKFQYAKFSDLRFTDIVLDARIQAPGAIQWWGKNKYIAVADQSGRVYKTKGPRMLDKLILDGICQLGQYTITKSKLIAPDPCAGVVYLYPFPGGGNRILTIHDKLSAPMGSALSLSEGQELEAFH